MTRRPDRPTARKTTRCSAPRRAAGRLPNCQSIDMLSGLRVAVSAGLGGVEDRNAHPSLVGLPRGRSHGSILSPFLDPCLSATPLQPVLRGRMFVVQRAELGAAAPCSDDPSPESGPLLAQNADVPAPKRTSASRGTARQAVRPSRRGHLEVGAVRAARRDHQWDPSPRQSVAPGSSGRRRNPLDGPPRGRTLRPGPGLSSLGACHGVAHRIRADHDPDRPRQPARVTAPHPPRSSGRSGRGSGRCAGSGARSGPRRHSGRMSGAANPRPFPGGGRPNGPRLSASRPSRRRRGSALPSRTSTRRRYPGIPGRSAPRLKSSDLRSKS